MLIDCSEKTDEELVALVIKNVDYYECLVSRYQEKLERYIQRISNVTKEDREDLLQDIFVKVYLKLNSFDGSLKFSSWIYRITHNEVIDHFRRTKSAPKYVEIDAEDENFVDHLKADFNLVDEVHTKVMYEKVVKAFNKLEVKYKEVLVLKYIEDKDYSAISDILRKPMGTVSTLLDRAKKQLKEHLNEK